MSWHPGRGNNDLGIALHQNHRMPNPCLAALAFAILVGCNSTTGSAPAAPPTPAQAAMARIEALIGDARCDDNAECRSVAIGQRACGGPESYLAWSSRRTDAATLERAVAEFAAASRPARPGDALSTCEVLRDPGAFCARDAARPGTAGRCRLRPARGPEALRKL